MPRTRTKREQELFDENRRLRRLLTGIIEHSSANEAVPVLFEIDSDDDGRARGRMSR